MLIYPLTALFQTINFKYETNFSNNFLLHFDYASNRFKSTTKKK